MASKAKIIEAKLAALIDRWLAGYERRQALAALAAMDDRDWSDLGLARGARVR